MALNEGMLSLIAEQNSAKRLMQKVSITTTAAVTTLALVTIDDQLLTLPSGASLCLQSDQDFFYELRKTGATTAVTDYTGARPGVKVLAGQQEYVLAGTTDKVIDLKAASTTGSVAIFLVRSV